MSENGYIISSFGFKHGLPDDSEFVFDVRCLSNPYWVDEMRDKCGLDSDVDAYVFSDSKATELLYNIADVLSVYAEISGDFHKKVYIGCTGGQHRSVAFAERLYKLLCKKGIPCTVSHREYARFCI